MGAPLWPGMMTYHHGRCEIEFPSGENCSSESWLLSPEVALLKVSSLNDVRTIDATGSGEGWREMKKSSTLCAPPFLAGLTRRVPCTKAPLIFHPLEGDTRRPVSAVALCHGCPVTSECRQWARKQGEFGIWGGETDDERQAAVRYRSRAKGAARSKPQPVKRAEAPVPARENGWRPYLSPSEELVLDYLRAGYDRESMTTELGRSRLAVSRAIGGLCRKLCTSEVGIVSAARTVGLFLTPGLRSTRSSPDSHGREE